MRKLLTDAFIRSIDAPSSGRIEVTDLRCVGLTIRVTPNKVKSWSFRFRDPRSSRVTRSTIGAYPHITLEKARERGLALRKEVEAGVNPVEKKREDRERASTRTFQALADRYMTEHARRHKRTADNDQRLLRLHVLPAWAKRPFDSIGRSDVIALCESVVAKDMPIQANRVQALISKVFSFALDAELVAANPCTRLKKRSKEVRATRVLSDDEIRLFWRKIGESPNSQRMGQALRLVLLTGVRVTELAGAEVNEFERLDDPERATWMIPAVRSKNERAHLVPLVSQALAIVVDLLKEAERRADAKRGARFLLVSPTLPDKPIGGHSLSVAMGRFGKVLASQVGGRRLSCDDARAIATWTATQPSAHDLRRTLATRLSSFGIPAEDVSACLNHARRSVTARHYDQYERAREKRRALTLWAQQIGKIVDGALGANVVLLKAAN